MDKAQFEKILSWKPSLSRCITSRAWAFNEMPVLPKQGDSLKLCFNKGIDVLLGRDDWVVAEMLS